MGEYSRSGQYGDLSKAVDRAKKGRSAGKKGKGALVAATLITGGILAGGLALGNSGDVPPHEERVAYLMKSLPEGKNHSLRYSDYFQVGRMARADNKLASSATLYGRTSGITLGLLDVSPDDGKAHVDYGFLVFEDRTGARVCLIPDEELGELEEKMDEHYVVSSDAWYRALTEGNETIEGVLGKDEYVEMYRLCDGRWQSAEDAVLESAADIPSHEERVAYFIREYSDEWFRMGYSPDFSEAHAWSSLRNHFWVYAAYPLEPGMRTRKAIGVVDGADADDPADGEPDWAWAQLPSGRVGNFCMVEYEKLPDDVQNMLDEFYELGSEGFYRHVTDGAESYEGNIDDKDFFYILRACWASKEN